MSDLEDLKAGKLIPRDADTKHERIVKHLRRARLYIPLTDEELNQKYKRHSEMTLTKNKDAYPPDSKPAEVWLFSEFLENNEFEMAWDELRWACEQVDVAFRIGGGNMRCDKCNHIRHWKDPHDIGASRDGFWQGMARAAREMMSE